MIHRVNINNFTQQRCCKDITAGIEVSPSPYDKEAYDAWKKKKEKEKQDKLPMVLDNDDVIGYDSKSKAKKRKEEDNAKVA